MKIPNIRESIDFESRNFKTSNITITFSNYANLSDTLSESDIMNKEVAIFWKSQSCKTLADCMLIYTASIRRFDHDDKTVKLQLEDSTQAKLTKEVPIAKLGA